MKEKRDLKIGIKSDREFIGELKELAGRIDEGWLPEKTIERLYFNDLPSLLKHLTPQTLRTAGRTAPHARRALEQAVKKRQ